MPKRKRDSKCEERIEMEIIVDAYGPEEQAMGWYYYLSCSSVGEDCADFACQGVQ